MEQTSFYVGIEDPTTLRRKILEDLKTILQILKRYEHFRDKRAEKRRLVLEYKTIISELSSSIEDLKKELPAIKLKDLPKLKPQIIQIAPTPPKPFRVVKKKEEEQLTEMEKIERELEQVEKKLKGL